VLAAIRRLLPRPRMTRLRSLSTRWVGPYTIYYFHYSNRGFNAGSHNPRPLRLGCWVCTGLVFRGSHAGRQLPRPLRTDTHTGSCSTPTSRRPHKHFSALRTSTRRTSSRRPRWLPLGPPSTRPISTSLTFHPFRIPLGSRQPTHASRQRGRTPRPLPCRPSCAPFHHG